MICLGDRKTVVLPYLRVANVKRGELDLGEELDRLLDLLANKPTETVEIIATLFAAWNDALIDGHTPSDVETIRDVRENWHPSKQRFKEPELKKWLDWMRQHALVPKGRGPHTRGSQVALRLH